MADTNTSWGSVAEWYDELLEEDASTYQKELILPNLMRLCDIKKGETVLDLACGQGFFARALASAGAKVIAADIAGELIALAKEKQTNEKNSKAIIYHTAPADALPFIAGASIDKAIIVLAIQNIENLHGTLAECARVLKKGAPLFIVLNHPAFRIPKESSWGFDEKEKVQYRRIDRYLSESKVKIIMHPGAKSKEATVSFHRPLQAYMKAFTKAGFAVTRLEEWNSHKTSEKGPRQEAEDRARKEIPLFMLLEAKRIA